MTTTADVEWPRWEDPAFYAQDPDVVQASMNAARRESPIYRYSAPGLATDVWVVSRWEDCRAIVNDPDQVSTC